MQLDRFSIYKTFIILESHNTLQGIYTLNFYSYHKTFEYHELRAWLSDAPVRKLVTKLEFLHHPKCTGCTLYKEYVVQFN